MIKKILNRSRVRTVHGGFAFIPHRFLTDGFIKRLEPDEILFYLFLILTSDAHGLSYYGDSAICRLLKMQSSDLDQIRQCLISHDLIAYDPPLYQVLELPCQPVLQKDTGLLSPSHASDSEKNPIDSLSSSPSSYSDLIQRLKN